MPNNSGRIVTPIGEVGNHLNKRVNLVGVVVEFSLPRKSKGTDWYSVLKVVDDSQRDPVFSVRFFTQKKDQLPHVRSSRDLIVLHNVLIHYFQDEVAARFNSKFSSFALFNGKGTDNFCCYQCFGCFSTTWSELHSLKNLRHWLSTAQLNSGRSDYLVTMNDISRGAYFDLVCKVLHVSYEASEGLQMLFVWDGTDLPPLSLVGNIKDEEQNPLPLQIESSPLDQNIIPQFPTLGSTLRVFADKAHENIGLHLQGGGRWVRIRNMTCRTLSGMWSGALTATSRLLLLEDDDSVVVEYIMNFEKRKTDHDRSPLWGNPPSGLTEITLPAELGYATLMDIMCYKEDGVFSSIVRVVAIQPSQVDDILSSSEISGYKMRLTLEDPTARIHALLSAEEWVFFFGEFTYSGEMNAKLKSILGVPEHQNAEDGGERFPPWIRCCIETRRRDDDDDDSRGRCYSICCTKLASTQSVS